MARNSSQLKIEKQRIISGSDVFETYGQWNALIAESASGEFLGWVPAHDGDFFPESVSDHIEAIRSARSRSNTELPIFDSPIRVDIDITQICNACCTFCFSRPYQKAGYRGEIAEAQLLERLIGELGQLGTRTIRFCGGGEPLTHPEIRNILPLPHKHGMKFCVITNGDLLDNELSEFMFEYVDHIRWSVNASSNQTRLRIHRPKPGSNLLSETFDQIRAIVAQRQHSRPGERRPLISTTFLILPNNMSEIIPAAQILKEIGVDSVSFRPVYHDLGEAWIATDLERLSGILEDVKALADPPKYYIFTPKRCIMESPKLCPRDYFKYCLSRRLRTVLEATSDGLALQSCGMYRGSGAIPELVYTGESHFGVVWQRAQTNSLPFHAPEDCCHCIDVSMNVTLNFIWDILSMDPSANFQRIFIDEL
ncbi:MAG: radical SAM protein [Anaerolineae bacterium]|nr:radical SAM protein [Anaerolineae bacterium]